jgi:hypothetical protein
MFARNARVALLVGFLRPPAAEGFVNPLDIAEAFIPART